MGVGAGSVITIDPEVGEKAVLTLCRYLYTGDATGGDRQFLWPADSEKVQVGWAL